MQEQVLKLCKRLGKFTIDDILGFIDIDEDVLKTMFTLCPQIKQNGDIYNYIKNSIPRKEQPFFFGYYSEECIREIQRCFCAEIEHYKIVYLLGKGTDSVDNFVGFFRQTIYEKQLEELQNHFKNNPKKPYEREFFEKIFFFYFYDDRVFVSDKKLSPPVEKPHLKTEEQEFKRSIRLLKDISPTIQGNTYIAEAIWRRNKKFEELEFELKNLIF